MIVMINLVKNAEPVAWTETDFPFCADANRTFQRFAVSGFRFRVGLELRFNGIAYQRMIFWINRFNVPPDKRRVNRLEYLFRRHYDYNYSQYMGVVN